MPLDKEKRTLYVDYANGYGISLIDVANCLRDYRRDKDGNIDLGMMCTSEKINLLSKFKPTDFPELEQSEYYYMGDGSKDGYYLGYECYGVKKPYIIGAQFNVLGINGVPTGQPKKITGIKFADLLGDWVQPELDWKRLDDFENYTAIAKANRFTNNSNPFVASVSVMNPNGAIAGSVTFRYNWEDIVHEDGKCTTLGLKSLLACDGVNSQAYLGLAVYRTQVRTPNTNKVLVPISVTVIHTAPLGTVCPNTGMVESHNVAFELDDLISGTESSISDGYTNFYNGEKDINAIPFIAKWNGSMWCLIGLGIEPYIYMSQISTQGGTGSMRNNVKITQVQCRMRAVRLSDGTIRLGIDDNSDFAITVTGQGDLAFRRNNMFYITPADGNSILRSQSGVRLGVSDNTTLDLPVTAVSSGTYNASSLMLGRTSGATYISAPTSVFQPYGTTRFKVGFTIEYYKELRTWTFLNGSVEVDPNNLQDYYTITINA